MKDKHALTDMLSRADIPFLEKRTSMQIDRVEIDGGNGAVAIFTFTSDGMLQAVDIDKDAYS